MSLLCRWRRYDQADVGYTPIMRRPYWRGTYTVCCPLGAVNKYFMHRGLAYVVARILRQAGAAKMMDIVFEVSNLRQGDKARPGDVVWLNFLGPGQQHLLIDVSITGVYRDAVLDDVNRVPGFAAKAREDAKLDEDFRSASPVSQVHGGRHRLVPLFVLEEGGEVWRPRPCDLAWINCRARGPDGQAQGARVVVLLQPQGRRRENSPGTPDPRSLSIQSAGVTG